MMFWDITTWFFIFVRVSAYLLIFPLTAAQGIPAIVRLGFAGLSAFIIMPLVSPVILDQASFIDVIRLVFVEVSTGLVLGLLARFLFYGIEIAGSIIATETGLMLSTNFNPVTSSFGSAPGALLHWMAIVLLFSLNLHHWMIIGLQRSYEIIPAGGAQLNEMVLSSIVNRGSGMFVI